MAALSDNLTCSLVRGNSSPMAKINGNTMFSVAYRFEPSMLYNVKRSKGSGIVRASRDYSSICFVFLKLLVACLLCLSLISNQRALNEFFSEALPFYLIAWSWPDNQRFDGRIFC